MSLVALVWITVAVYLWLRHKSSAGKEPVSVHGPPQQTFIGALMWPFYLAAYLWDSIRGK